MAWYGVITDAGKTAIEEHLAYGTSMNLNLVKTGTAVVPAANMRAMTDVSAQADTGSIIGKRGTANGAEIQISVQASETRYVMKEIGLFATLEDDRVVLIAYYNDDGIGIEIPAVDDFPDFNYILFCLLDIINSDDLTITMDMTHSVLISQIINNLLTPSGTEGKVLDARQGKVLKELIDDVLPDVTSADNGKFLTVVNGAWAATAMQEWQGGSY